MYVQRTGLNPEILVYSSFSPNPGQILLILYGIWLSNEFRI